MLQKFRQLLGHTIIYGLGNYGIKLVGFLLIPLYTRYLKPADYGIMAMVSMYTQVMFILMNLGQSTSLFRFYYEHDDQASRDRVIAASVWLVLLIALPLASLPLFGSTLLAKHLLGNGTLWFLMCIGTGTVICKVFLRMPFAVMRAEEESKRYASWSVARNAVSASLAVIFVVVLHQGVNGIIFSQFLAELIFCFLLARATIRTLTSGFHWADVKVQLMFGLPFVPAGVGSFVLDLADRWFIKHYASINEVGIYSLGYRFGEIVTFIISAISLSWPQFLFANRKEPNAPNLYAYATTYYLVTVLYVCLGLGVLAPEMLRVMATPPYYPAASVVLLISLSGLFDGLTYFVNVGVLFSKRSIWRMVSVLTAAVVNIALNFLLIPTYGMMGAAWATMIAFAVQAAVTMTVSLRLYHVPYQYRRIAQLIVVAAAIYAASVAVSFHTLVTSIAFKAALLLTYPLLLAVSGFFDATEVAQARAWLNRFANSGRFPVFARPLLLLGTERRRAKRNLHDAR